MEKKGDNFSEVIERINGGNASNTYIVANTEHVEEEKLFERKAKDGILKDRGWAWFVLLGAFLEMFLLVGIVKSSGILFVAFQEKFTSSSSVTSLLSTVQNICQSIMALLVMTFGIKITTCRYLLFIGSIITCVAFIITSQATDIRLLLLSHGVLQGIGAGFMQPTALTMVSLYFERRRGLANSIAVSGGPVGGLLFAPLITKLLSTYGYQGCVLIIAGILLNGCVIGALFRPTSFYSRKGREQSKNDGDGRETQNLFSKEDKFDAEPDPISLNSYVTDDIPCEKYTPVVSLFEQEIEIHSYVSTNNNNKTMLNGGERKVQCNRLECLSQRDGRTNISKEYVKNSHNRNLVSNISPKLEISETGGARSETVLAEDKEFSKAKSQARLDRKVRLENEVHEIKQRKVVFGKTTASSRSVSKLLCNYSLLTSPVFYAFLIQGSLICSGTVVAPIFIAPYARDIGVSIEGAATLVTTQSCIDLFSRIIIGYISDKRWIRRSNLVAIATLIVSLSSSLVRFYTNYNILLGYSIVLGLVSGVYFSLFPVILIDYLTLANFQTCLGFMALVHGFSVAGTFYLVGYLRDIFGSYAIPHHVIGAATGVGTIILFLLPEIQRLQRRL